MKCKFRVLTAVTLIATLLVGCGQKFKLDPKNPITITVWHYYGGAVLNAFDRMLEEFNSTVGKKKGIIIEGNSFGHVDELEKAVTSSANKEVGSKDMPNIFSAYADIAYGIEQRGLLANLDNYLSEDVLNMYEDSFIEEGRIGNNGELKIFPIAKSTEALMLNDTDWLPFAQAENISYDDISTMEGMAETAKLYYEWTDKQTPDEPNDGKALFGRDAPASLFIISSRQFGTEIFTASGGKGTVNLDETIMRKIWDCYYVPFISGYYAANGRFRSDDTKVGDILSYVGSTSSSAFFPKEVTVDGVQHPIQAKVLPAPAFNGGEKVFVQQGAGMVVTSATPEEEYASVEFLKWFTAPENNIVFSGLSGYLPVQKKALDYDLIMKTLSENDITVDSVTDATIETVLAEIKNGAMYTSKAFAGATEARSILDNSLPNKAVADRQTVIELLSQGKTLDEAVAEFNTDENFNTWLDDMSQQLQAAIE
ncbi:MAG: extracellular solute-binding protein [Clostridiales bacterium]|jgi:multiple sugar transport system substrate-binding protein|nr:extracellular solute-binding protein [Clostridiales bacterium]